ncbi:MAG: PAS domain S-box protein [Planctomycetes bacterium]|nr:PAS domain S-box protein [Planctomycetota bacterium]
MSELKPNVSNGAALPSEWLRVAMTMLGDAVIATDDEGRIIYINNVAASITGWPDTEAVGQNVNRVVVVEGREAAVVHEGVLAQALRGGATYGLSSSLELVNRSGGSALVELGAATVVSASGSSLGIVLAFRDITALRRREHDVRDALEYADSIISTLREPFLVLDGEFRVMTANRAFYRTFRTDPERTEGSIVFDLGDGEWDFPSLRQTLEDVRSECRPIEDVAVEHEFKSIGSMVMLFNARPVAPLAHKPAMVLLAIEDITEQRRVAAVIRDSEQRYRRLFESAKDGILILDADDGSVIDANPYISQLLGYSVADLIGRPIWTVGLFEDEAENLAVFRVLKASGYVRYDHLPLRTSHGEIVEVEFVSNRYHVEGRNVAQCNIRDISERRRLEATARDQAMALADLHRRKDEFLAMLSHELRNPLAPIANSVGLLLLDSTLASAQREACAIIDRQVAQLTRLVGDLMEVARITTGQLILRVERVLVQDVVARAVETAQPLIDARKHHLDVTLPEEPIFLRADASRLEQTIVNLLANAAKYSDEEGEIELAVESRDGECHIRVKDFGEGIDPDFLPHVFDVFTQGGRALDRASGGLGIGLALVKKLVELHRGRVEVTSVRGGGSEFVVRLPEAAPPSKPSKPPLQPAMTSAPRGLRILVVDDNVDAADSFAFLFRAVGYEVLTEYSGLNAVAAVTSWEPHAVFLDIGLPELDGYQVAARLRAMPGNEGLLIVSVTGYSQESDRRKARESGFDHHLVKPVDFAQVQKLLAAIRPT